MAGSPFVVHGSGYALDMSLARYRNTRGSGRSPEPRGRQPGKRDRGSAGAPHFVIQHHAASTDHYDFRLEIDGVLASWAIPKGPSMSPSMSPKDKRMARRTEDHPLEYETFEGVIPGGEYGAGGVIVWDRGTYTNESDHEMAEGLDRGHLSFRPGGEKLRGGYALTRMRQGKDEAWLLVKRKDEDADARRNPGKHPARVGAVRTYPRGVAMTARPPPGLHEALHDEPVPDWRDPTLATLTDKRSSDPQWILERKFDGERCPAFRYGDRMRLLSRNRQPLTDSYPEIVDALAAQHTSQLVVDGDIVAFEGRRTSFSRLHGRIGISDPGHARASRIKVFYYLFDLLHLDGKATTELPLRQRKRLPRDAIELEGRRSTNWLKFKCVRDQEFVIGGYTPPRGSRAELGALLLGYYEGCDLVYAAKVGTDFDEDTLCSLREKMAPSSRRSRRSPVGWFTRAAPTGCTRC